MSRPVKRSFTIAGHRTSISLEAPFWEALKTAAVEEGVAVAKLIARIDASRGSMPTTQLSVKLTLASAINCTDCRKL